jgi:hypothetical protein
MRKNTDLYTNRTATTTANTKQKRKTIEQATAIAINKQK